MTNNALAEEWPQPGYADACDEFFGPGRIEEVHRDGTPRIVVEVPGIEGFDEVATLLQQAGAEITDEHRTFAVDGDLAIRALALMRLALYEDGNSDGNQLRIRYEGSMYTPPARPDRWWGDQQRKQAERRRRR